MTELSFSHVTAGYGGNFVLQDVTFQVQRGEVVTLVGPNGCGKTTLLRAAARQLRLDGGEICLEGRHIGQYGRKEFARKAAFMPQVRNIPAITVQSLICHGRFPYLGFSRKMSQTDRQAVASAMEETGVAGWAGRDLRELSGGERQRVYMAMALAQGTDVIFLDEPTTYLDLNHQFELLELIGRLNQKGKTVVMVLHDLAQAIRYSHRMMVMQDGRLAAAGTPSEILAGGCLERIFHVRVHVVEGGCYFTSERGADASDPDRLSAGTPVLNRTGRP